MKRIKELLQDKKELRKVLRIIFYPIILVIVLFFLLNVIIILSYKHLMYNTVDEVPEKQTALILGAEVYANKKLSEVFKDRCDIAINLYKHGKVKKVLISGDHTSKYYDEVSAAKKYLLENGVKEEDLFTDYAGIDTYDSITRSKLIFKVESMVIVTQSFHLSRALFISSNKNIDAVGFASDITYDTTMYDSFRENFARIKAIIDILLNSKPRFEGEETPILGVSTKSWDNENNQN